MQGRTIQELAWFNVGEPLVMEENKHVRTWAARCTSAGLRAGRKDAILGGGKRELVNLTMVYHVVMIRGWGRKRWINPLFFSFHCSVSVRCVDDGEEW
jgi:type IV secretory pathway TrbD component